MVEWDSNFTASYKRPKAPHPRLDDDSIDYSVNYFDGISYSSLDREIYNPGAFGAAKNLGLAALVTNKPQPNNKLARAIINALIIQAVVFGFVWFVIQHSSLR